MPNSVNPQHSEIYEQKMHIYTAIQ